MLQFAANPKSDMTSKIAEVKNYNKTPMAQTNRKNSDEISPVWKKSINQSIDQYVPLSRRLQSCLQEVGARTSRLSLQPSWELFHENLPGIKPDQNMEIGS